MPHHHRSTQSERPRRSQTGSAKPNEPSLPEDYNAILPEPYRTLAIAGAVGFVLGNGVLRHALHLLFGLGTKFAIESILGMGLGLPVDRFDTRSEDDELEEALDRMGVDLASEETTEEQPQPPLG